MLSFLEDLPSRFFNSTAPPTSILTYCEVQEDWQGELAHPEADFSIFRFIKHIASVKHPLDLSLSLAYSLLTLLETHIAMYSMSIQNYSQLANSLQALLFLCYLQENLAEVELASNHDKEYVEIFLLQEH